MADVEKLHTEVRTTMAGEPATAAVLLAERAGQAVHERVCDCRDRGFGYTLRTRDLDAIGPAATAAVLRALRVLVDIGRTPDSRSELSAWLSDRASELEIGPGTVVSVTQEPKESA